VVDDASVVRVGPLFAASEPSPPSSSSESVAAPAPAEADAEDKVVEVDCSDSSSEEEADDARGGAEPFAALLQSAPRKARCVLPAGRVSEPGSAPQLPRPRDVTDFLSALPLVREALLHLRKGLEYFVLDGFVTDHFEAQKSVSDAYRFSAFWERDPKRAAAMHRRRSEVLVPLLGACNPSIFVVLHKEGSIAAAQASHEEADLRIHAAEQRAEQTGSKASRADLLAIQDTLHRAIFLYHHFTRCYNDPRIPWPAGAADADPSAPFVDLAATPDPLPPAPADPTALPPPPACIRSLAAATRAVSLGLAKPPETPEDPPVAPAFRNLAVDAGFAAPPLHQPLLGATSLDSESVVAYLTAHFCVARLLTKRISASPDEAIRDVKEALLRHRWLVHNAPRLRASPDDFERELEVCREVVELYPLKLQQLYILRARAAAAAAAAPRH
jgi:hypothetical protein